MANKALVCQLLQRLLAFSKFYFFFPGERSEAGQSPYFSDYSLESMKIQDMWAVLFLTSVHLVKQKSLLFSPFLTGSWLSRITLKCMGNGRTLVHWPWTAVHDRWTEWPKVPQIREIVQLALRAYNHFVSQSFSEKLAFLIKCLSNFLWTLMGLRFALGNQLPTCPITFRLSSQLSIKGLVTFNQNFFCV